MPLLPAASSPVRTPGEDAKGDDARRAMPGGRCQEGDGPAGGFPGPDGTRPYSGTPARLRLVRMVCKVCTRLTVGRPVRRWVN